MTVAICAFARKCGSHAKSLTPTCVACTISERYGGHVYVSMEYVDGEDLAALLRRIGRLPLDKGIEVARKLCAGLAAAHAKGVLHRDLKPRNIMIDGHGGVRIMDFGIAVVADHLDPADIGSGTPAYMAPEQLAGREVTQQSDLYALGLVLFELFTGRPPFHAKSVHDLLRLRETFEITKPSLITEGLSETIDRAILRCLEPNPRRRTQSALEVAAALPSSGDPLAEALAAGETPSPATVAASGATEALRPQTGIALLTCIAASLTAVCFLTPRIQLVGRLPLEHPPQVLAAKARDIAQSLGYSQRASDFGSGFAYDERQMQYLRRTITGVADEKKRQWDDVLSNPPYPVSFWYRQSSSPLVPRPTDPLSWSFFVPDVSPPRSAETLTVHVDVQGRLLRFVALTPPATSGPAASQHSHWPAIFAAAGLDLSQFTADEPRASAPGVADSQLAWTGVYPRFSEPIRVEAATFKGNVVFFDILFPWTISDRTTNRDAHPWLLSEDIVLLAVVALIAAVATHNWKAGRGDPAGAWHLGVYTAAAYACSLLLIIPSSTLPSGIWLPIAFSAAFGLVIGSAYLALEPWVRRLWPHTMITWARLLSGKWRDPVVCRDLLVAIACATANHAIQRTAQVVALSLGNAPVQPESSGTLGFYLGNLTSTRLMTADMILAFVRSLDVLMFFVVLLIARAVLKKQWRATVVYLAFWSLVLAAPHVVEGDWVVVIYWIVELSLLLFLMLRFGLLATVAFGTMSILISRSVLTTNLGAWYGQSTLVAVVIVSGLALVVFRLALGGRPVWNLEILDK